MLKIVLKIDGRIGSCSAGIQIRRFIRLLFNLQEPYIGMMKKSLNNWWISCRATTNRSNSLFLSSASQDQEQHSLGISKPCAARRITYDWKYLLLSGLWILVAYFGLIEIAQAATGNAGSFSANFSFFDAFQETAESTSVGWGKTITSLAKNTFFILATIELCWSAAIWAMEKDNLNSLASELMQKIMFISFFYMILLNAQDWFPLIIRSFTTLGQETIGNVTVKADGSAMADGITPDSIIATSFAIVKLIWEKSPLNQTDVDASNGWDIVDTCFLLTDLLPIKWIVWALSLVLPHDIGEFLKLLVDGPCIILNIILHIHIIIVAIFATIIIVIAYIIIAFQLLCVNIESYVLLAAGMIFLGLGGSRWTNEYVTKLFAHSMMIGMRILVLLLILGLSKTIVDDMVKNYTFDIVPLLKLMGIAIVQTILAMRAPEMANSLMTGQGVGVSMGSVAASARNISAAGQMLKRTLQAPGKAVSSAKSKIDAAQKFMSKGDKGGGGSIT